MTVAEAARVVSLDDVVFVAHRTPMALTVDAQRQAVRSDEVHGFAVFNGVAGYAGLSGQGVEVVVADSGVDDRHPDFHRWSQSGEDLGSRVVGPGPIDGEDHGTKVAGLIAGNGAGSEESEVQGIVGEPYQFRGHAPQVSQIVSVDTPADTGGWRAEGAFDAEPTGDVLEVRTMADGGDRFVLEPESSIVADDYEKLTFRMKLDVEQGLEHRWPRFYVVRWDRDGDGNNDAHAYPRYDESEKDGQWRTFEFDLAGKPRRWKEQMHRMIVRPVVYDDRIIAPRKRDGYSGSGGTSLAAPVVSGAVALMLEQFVERHGVDLDAAPPLPSTVKALLLHTADDLIRDEAPARATPNPDTEEGVAHGRGPDFATGFGLLDAKEAVDLVGAHTPDAPRFREEKIASGEIHVYRIPVEGNEPLRVTLAWDDAPGDAATSQLQPKLVNDLDVVAVSPEGVGHSPWLLDPLPIDPTAYNGIYAPPGDTIASVSQRSRLGIGAKAGDVSALVQVQHAVEWGLFGGNALTDPVLFAH